MNDSTVREKTENDMLTYRMPSVYELVFGELPTNPAPARRSRIRAEQSNDNNTELCPVACACDACIRIHFADGKSSKPPHLEADRSVHRLPPTTFISPDPLVSSSRKLVRYRGIQDGRSRRARRCLAAARWRPPQGSSCDHSKLTVSSQSAHSKLMDFISKTCNASKS